MGRVYILEEERVLEMDRGMAAHYTCSSLKGTVTIPKTEYFMFSLTHTKGVE